MIYEHVQPIARTVLHVAQQVILSSMCRSMSTRVIRNTIRENHREVHDMHQDAEDKEVSTEEYGMIKSKVFYYHSVQYIIIAKIKTKTSQRNELCKYEIDTSSNGHQNVQSTISQHKDNRP